MTYIQYFERLLLCVILIFADTSFGQFRPLESYNVDTAAISISGSSSGGAFATQYHVALSSTLMGVGVLLSVPYACNEAGTSDCMSDATLLDVDVLVNVTASYEAAGLIDATSNMADDRVFVLNGALDTTVDPLFGPEVVEFYGHYVTSSNIGSHFTLQAEHGMPTWDRGVACDTQDVFGGAYLNRCQYDCPFETLAHIYPGIQRPDYDNLPSITGDFYEYDQAAFFSSPADHTASSMDEAGFIYVPSGCVTRETSCRLHVAVHGCITGRSYVGTDFALWAGHVEVAEINDIIVLFPQVKSLAGVNPMGCWDWWAYTGDGYATKYGVQISAVSRMVDVVAGRSP